MSLCHTFWMKVLLSAAGCIGAIGCCQPKQSIGSNHVAVLSVTRWDDYKGQLQPQFNLSASDALNTGIADTLQTDQAVAHAFEAAATLKLAPSAKLPAGFGTGQSGEGLTPPAPSTPTSIVTPPTTAIDKTTLKTDPYLQYLAGTALFQEVKMLNRYVTDAAVFDGYRGYIVRLQISTMPTVRDQPLDAYTDISMFLDPVDQGVTATAKAETQMKNMITYANDKIDPMPKGLLPPHDGGLPSILKKVKLLEDNHDFVTAHKQLLDHRAELLATKPSVADPGHVATQPTEDQKAILETYHNQLDEHIATLETLLNPAPNNDPPMIIPLLVTDEVEAALAARRADDLQQLSLSLAAAYAGIGGTASVTNVQDAMQASLSRDYNSLFSVARVNDNTVRVRIGARQTGKNASILSKIRNAEPTYEMTNQTHNVSLLVLVPEGKIHDKALTVYFGTRSMFINIDTGEKTEPAKDCAVTTRLNTRLTESDDFQKLISKTLEDQAIASDDKVADFANTVNKAAAAKAAEVQAIGAADKAAADAKTDADKAAAGRAVAEAKINANLANAAVVQAADSISAAAKDLTKRDTLLSKIARAAQNSRYGDYLEALNLNRQDAPRDSVGIANRMWIVLASERMESLYDGGKFTVPPYLHIDPATEASNVAASLIDDGKKITASVIVPTNTDPKGLVGWLKLKDNWELPASQAVLQDNVFTLTFPTIKKMKLFPLTNNKEATGTNEVDTIPLSAIIVRSDGKPVLTITHLAYNLTAADDKKAIAKPSVDRAELAPGNTRTDTPNLTLNFDPEFAKTFEGKQGLKPEELPVITVTGATFSLPSTLKDLPAGWGTDPKRPGAYTINPAVKGIPMLLTGLVPDSTVTFTISLDGSGYDPAPLSLKVAALARPEPKP